MKTPPHVVVYRSVASGVAVLVLLAFGFGLAGYGPLAPFHRLARPVTHYLHLDRIRG
jgi:hypothetical protein